MRGSKKASRTVIDSEPPKQKKRHFFFMVVELHSSLCHWRNLKDFIRDNMKRDKAPGWTQVNTPERIGYFTVTTGTNARAIFSSFIEAHPKSLIHYFCIDGASEISIQDLEDCNCHTILGTRGHSDSSTGTLMKRIDEGWEQYNENGPQPGSEVSSPSSSAAVPSTISTISTTTASSPESLYSQPSLIGHFGRVTISEQPCYPAYSYSSLPTVPYSDPSYSNHFQSYHTACSTYPEPEQWASSSSVGPYLDSSSNSISRNTNDVGVLRIISLGIIVTNIHYKMRRPDFENLLTQHGFPPGTYANLDFRSKPNDDKASAGSATVRFLRRTDAVRARDELHGKEWRGRPLKVREDPKPPIEGSSPPVANGSTC